MSNDKNKAVPIYKTILGVITISMIFISIISLALKLNLLLGEKLFPSYSGGKESLTYLNGWIRWFFGDMTEATFFKHEFPAILMIVCVFIAQWATKKGFKWQGFSLAYGTGLGVWILLSSTVGLILSNLIWGWTIPASEYGWQPTFVAFVSLPASVILMYGKGWRNSITGAVLGALLVTPTALLLVNYVCIPLGIQGVVGNTLAMAIGTVLGFTIISMYPSMVIKQDAIILPSIEDNHNFGFKWAIRRVLADFTESQFFGNEITSFGLLLGIILVIIFNPTSAAYGTNLIDEILISQVITSSLGVIIWRQKYIEKGWYATYIPVVSVAPAVVLAFGGTITSIILGSVLGALMGPPLATAIASKVPKNMHPYIGNVTSMAVSSLIIVYVLSFVI